MNTDKTSELTVDNRGSEDVPFGYVYVEDTRVGFGNTEVWPANGWHCTDAHLNRAADHLTEVFGYGWYAEEYE